MGSCSSNMAEEQEYPFKNCLKDECMYVQSCPTLCDPVDCSLLGSSVHGILQARILEWVAIPFSRGSYQPRNRTHISCVSSFGRHILYHGATWEAPSQREPYAKTKNKKPYFIPYSNLTKKWIISLYVKIKFLEENRTSSQS